MAFNSPFGVPLVQPTSTTTTQQQNSPAKQTQQETEAEASLNSQPYSSNLLAGATTLNILQPSHTATTPVSTPTVGSSLASGGTVTGAIIVNAQGQVIGGDAPVGSHVVTTPGMGGGAPSSVVYNPAGQVITPSAQTAISLAPSAPIVSPFTSPFGQSSLGTATNAFLNSTAKTTFNNQSSGQLAATGATGTSPTSAFSGNNLDYATFGEATAPTIIFSTIDPNQFVGTYELNGQKIIYGGTLPVQTGYQSNQSKTNMAVDYAYGALNNLGLSALPTGATNATPININLDTFGVDPNSVSGGSYQLAPSAPSIPTAGQLAGSYTPITGLAAASSPYGIPTTGAKPNVFLSNEQFKSGSVPSFSQPIDLLSTSGLANGYQGTQSGQSNPIGVATSFGQPANQSNQFRNLVIQGPQTTVSNSQQPTNTTEPFSYGSFFSSLPSAFGTELGNIANYITGPPINASEGPGAPLAGGQFPYNYPLTLSDINKLASTNPIAAQALQNQYTQLARQYGTALPQTMTNAGYQYLGSPSMYGPNLWPTVTGQLANAGARSFVGATALALPLAASAGLAGIPAVAGSAAIGAGGGSVLNPLLEYYLGGVTNPELLAQAAAQGGIYGGYLGAVLPGGESVLKNVPGLGATKGALGTVAGATRGALTNLGFTNAYSELTQGTPASATSDLFATGLGAGLGALPLAQLGAVTKDLGTGVIKKAGDLIDALKNIKIGDNVYTIDMKFDPETNTYIPTKVNVGKGSYIQLAKEGHYIGDSYLDISNPAYPKVMRWDPVGQRYYAEKAGSAYEAPTGSNLVPVNQNAQNIQQNMAYYFAGPYRGDTYVDTSNPKFPRVMKWDPLTGRYQVERVASAYDTGTNIAPYNQGYANLQNNIRNVFAGPYRGETYVDFTYPDAPRIMRWNPQTNSYYVERVVGNNPTGTAVVPYQSGPNPTLEGIRQYFAGPYNGDTYVDTSNPTFPKVMRWDPLRQQYYTERVGNPYTPEAGLPAVVNQNAQNIQANMADYFAGPYKGQQYIDFTTNPDAPRVMKWDPLQGRYVLDRVLSNSVIPPEEQHLYDLANNAAQTEPQSSIARYVANLPPKIEFDPKTGIVRVYQAVADPTSPQGFYWQVRQAMTQEQFMKNPNLPIPSGNPTYYYNAPLQELLEQIRAKNLIPKPPIPEELATTPQPPLPTTAKPEAGTGTPNKDGTVTVMKPKASTQQTQEETNAALETIDKRLGTTYRNTIMDNPSLPPPTTDELEVALPYLKAYANLIVTTPQIGKQVVVPKIPQAQTTPPVQVQGQPQTQPNIVVPGQTQITPQIQPQIQVPFQPQIQPQVQIPQEIQITPQIRKITEKPTEPPLVLSKKSSSPEELAKFDTSQGYQSIYSPSLIPRLFGAKAEAAAEKYYNPLLAGAGLRPEKVPEGAAPLVLASGGNPETAVTVRSPLGGVYNPAYPQGQSITTTETPTPVSTPTVSQTLAGAIPTFSQGSPLQQTAGFIPDPTAMTIIQNPGTIAGPELIGSPTPSAFQAGDINALQNAINQITPPESITPLTKAMAASKALSLPTPAEPIEALSPTTPINTIPLTNLANTTSFTQSGIGRTFIPSGATLASVLGYNQLLRDLNQINPVLYSASNIQFNPQQLLQQIQNLDYNTALAVFANLPIMQRAMVILAEGAANDLADATALAQGQSPFSPPIAQFQQGSEKKRAIVQPSTVEEEMVKV